MPKSVNWISPAFFRKDFAVSLHEDRAICTHAFECLHEGGIGFTCTSAGNSL